MSLTALGALVPTLIRPIMHTPNLRVCAICILGGYYSPPSIKRYFVILHNSFLLRKINDIPGYAGIVAAIVHGEILSRRDLIDIVRIF